MARGHISHSIFISLNTLCVCSTDVESSKYYYLSQVFLRRRRWHPTPVLLPGKSHGWRSLVGYSPWGREESDMTERLHFHFTLSCIGEGNGTPLQYSCLENPRDGGAWWAAVSGVAQSWTRLKRLSSSSSSSYVLLQGIFLTQESNLGLLHLLYWQTDSLPLHHLRSHSILLEA